MKRKPAAPDRRREAASDKPRTVEEWKLLLAEYGRFLRRWARVIAEHRERPAPATGGKE